MRRQIIILFVAMFVAVGAAYAGYPERYSGDPLPDGCFEVEVWLDAYHDMNPWSMPDPTGRYFLFGQLCVEGGVAHLELTQFAWRRCREAPWGTPWDAEICTAYCYRAWEYGDHLMAWDEAGFYRSGVWLETRDGEPVHHFDALTWHLDEDAGWFVQGVWRMEATIFLVDDDRYTRSVYRIRPRQTECTVTTRTGATRRSKPQ